MARLKAKPTPKTYVSFTELKHLRYSLDDESDLQDSEKISKQIIARLRTESNAIDNPNLECWTCGNNVNLVQIKQYRTSFFRRVFSTDGQEVHRKYFCSSCGIWLAAFDWKYGWRLTGASTPTITTAQREGLMPTQIPQVYKDRQKVKSITVLGKGGKVVVFNSTGTLSAAAQGMYKHLDRLLERMESVEMAADVALEIMTQLRKSSADEGTRLDDFKGKYVYEDLEGTEYKQPGVLVRDKWYYMFAKLQLSKQEMDDQRSLRTSVMYHFEKVGAWDARWENPVQAWYDLLLNLCNGTSDKNDAMQAYIVSRRKLHLLKLSAKQDEQRQTAVELAMQYVSLILELKPWKKQKKKKKKKKKKKNQVDVRVSIATWWDRTLAKGTLVESRAEAAETVEELVERAEDWLLRVTPIEIIEYFIGKTMRGEPASLINACAAAQVHGMQCENLRRIDYDDANRTYTLKQTG